MNADVSWQLRTVSHLVHDVVQPDRIGTAQIHRWILLRLVAPLLIGIAVLYATRNEYYSRVLGPLAWTLFVTHLVATFAFARSHILDTASFFPLIFASAWAAGLMEQGRLTEPRSLLIVGIPVVIYLTLSLAGRFRAARQAPVGSVSFAQVSGAILLLFVAIVVCSTSKTLVGFLFVPGLLIIPLVLLWSLVSGHNTE